MKKSEIAQKYPHTWAVYKNYRPYCKQSFYDSCINLFMYPNLPLEDIQEPTWIICERYLSNVNLFEQGQEYLRETLIDKITGKTIAREWDFKWKLIYTEAGALGVEDKLFNECCSTVQERIMWKRKEKTNKERCDLRQEILNSYTK